jgi:catechol 2,3-dioxygenase-like lactoylglutathione lyase family enzyme
MTNIVRPQPLIAVRDVKASAQWYCRLLGLETRGPESDHAHLYQRLWCGDELLMQIHLWDEEAHPNLMNAGAAPPGHGVLLWFETESFDAVVARARAMKAEVVEEPHVNPAPQHREIWLKDLDGYFVVVCSPDGEAEP